MKSIIIIILGFLIIAIESGFSKIKPDNFNYGIPCQTTQDCDLNQLSQNQANYLLFCDPYEEICICDPFDSMLDIDRKICVIKVNYNCNPHLESSYCVKNAICDPNTKSCTCIEGYLEALEGTCKKLAKFNGTCDDSSTISCGNVRSEIECLRGKCQCKFGSTNQFYDEKKHKCVSYEGAECAGSCIENTECVDVFQRDKYGNVSYPLVSLGLKCVSVPTILV